MHPPSSIESVNIGRDCCRVATCTSLTTLGVLAILDSVWWITNLTNQHTFDNAMMWKANGVGFCLLMVLLSYYRSDICPRRNPESTLEDDAV